MEKLVLLSALFVTLMVELCSAAGAYAQNPSGVRNQNNRVNDLSTVQREYGQMENQYATNLETIMQLLRERDVQEAEWRRNEALERENLLNELSVQKRGKDFRFYGSRGKRPSLDYQKRFQYFPSRG